MEPLVSPFVAHAPVSVLLDPVSVPVPVPVPAAPPVPQRPRQEGPPPRHPGTVPRTASAGHTLDRATVVRFLIRSALYLSDPAAHPQPAKALRLVRSRLGIWADRDSGGDPVRQSGDAHGR